MVTPHLTRPTVYCHYLDVDSTCVQETVAVALNGVSIVGVSDGSTRICSTPGPANMSIGGRLGAYGQATSGRSSCSLEGDRDGALYCGDILKTKEVVSYDKCGGFTDKLGRYSYKVWLCVHVTMLLAVTRTLRFYRTTPYIFFHTYKWFTFVLGDAYLLAAATAAVNRQRSCVCEHREQQPPRRSKHKCIQHDCCFRWCKHHHS